MNYYITILCMVFSLITFAQKVENDGKVYDVKNERIFLNGVEVTETLNAEKRIMILEEADRVSQKLKVEDKAKKEKAKAERQKDKTTKKLENDIEKAEKAQKKAEKALKKEQKLKANYIKAQAKLSKAQQKYERLKKKGKLSPIDENKWLEKIEKLTNKVDKAKRKL